MDLQPSCASDHGDCEVDNCEPTRILTLFKAYSFGDRFLVLVFRGRVNEGLISRARKPSWHPMNILEVATWAFEHIPADNHLLQLLVNRFCIEWGGESVYGNKAATTALQALPGRFMARVMRRYRDLINDGGLEGELTNGKCCHSEHAIEEEKVECGKLHMVYDEDDDYGYFR
jgi:hypothetical protein